MTTNKPKLNKATRPSRFRIGRLAVQKDGSGIIQTMKSETAVVAVWDSSAGASWTQSRLLRKRSQ
jgi:hypothetical protein